MKFNNIETRSTKNMCLFFSGRRDASKRYLSLFCVWFFSLFFFSRRRKRNWATQNHLTLKLISLKALLVIGLGCSASLAQAGSVPDIVYATGSCQIQFPWGGPWIVTTSTHVDYLYCEQVAQSVGGAVGWIEGDWNYYTDGLPPGSAHYHCGGGTCFDVLPGGAQAPFYGFDFYGSGGCTPSQFLGPISGTCKPLCDVTSQYLSVSSVCSSYPPCDPSQQTCRVPVPDPNQGGSCPSSGNPINTATGNKFQTEAGFKWGGGNEILLYYNSKSQREMGMGIGWSYTYARRVTPIKATLYSLPPSSIVDADWLAYIKGLLPPSGQIIAGYAIERDDGKSFEFNTDGSPVASLSTNPYSLTVQSNGFTVSDGLSTETYDATGNLLSISQVGGKTITLTRGYKGLLVGGSDNFGHSFTTSTFDWVHIKDITANGQTIAFGIDSLDRLASTTYPDATQRQYIYEDSSNPYLLTGVTDENGVRYVTWHYTPKGQAISSQHSAGADLFQLSFGSDPASGSIYTDETDPLGSTRRYTFIQVAKQWLLGGKSQPGGAGCGPAIGSQTFDADGNVASRTDFNGIKSTYIYDLTRNLETSRTEAAGTPQARTIITVWHATLRLPTQIIEPNRVTSFTYDTSGNLLTKAVTASGASRSWNYTYNNFGQVLTATDPDSNTTTYTYDTSGNLTTLTDAKGHITQFTSYDANGNLLAMTDPNGKVTTFTWDARNRLKSRQSGSDLTSYTYDLVGQLIQVTLPDNSTVTYSYDPAHRLTNISDSHGNSIAYTLDAAGNHTREDVSDPAGQLAAAQIQVASGQKIPNTASQ